MDSPNPKEYIIGSDAVYIPQGLELDASLACYDLQLPLMLRGPSGIGKTTLVEYLSSHLQLPLISAPCNEDTLAADLIGRNLHSGWVDGSATYSLRFPKGAIYYLDELGEARPDAMVVVHELTDDRRSLEVRANNETLHAPENFMVAASYNPAYQIQSKVKPSTAQRFITVDIPFPEPELEGRIVGSYLNPEEGEKERGKVAKAKKYKVQEDVPVKDLIKLAGDFRRMAESADAMGLREGPGPRLVARTAALMRYGLPQRTCIEVGMINPLTYNPEQKAAMMEVAGKLFR